MKTPISYYGGKQMMLRHILPMIPRHTTYCEPFFGGGAVFFAKPKSKQEIINDTNDVLINFYRVAQTRFDELAKEVSCYLYSRAQYYEARDIVLGRVEADDVKRAAAWWFYINTTINHKIHGAMRLYICRNDELVITMNNKKGLIQGALVQRLEGAMIECKDALKVIRDSDSPDTFFYIDPPYFNGDMGHYKGYTESDFNDLLDTIQGIKGKFLLSHYPCVNIDGRGWNTKVFNMMLASSTTHGNHPTRKKTKTECLTYNYSFEGEAVNLFEGGGQC
jgi:DNA adenine methylase